MGSLATTIWHCIRSTKSCQRTSIGRLFSWSPSSIWLRVLQWFLEWRRVLHWSNATMDDVFQWGYTSRRSEGRCSVCFSITKNTPILVPIKRTLLWQHSQISSIDYWSTNGHWDSHIATWDLWGFQINYQPNLGALWCQERRPYPLLQICEEIASKFGGHHIGAYTKEGE